MAKAITIGRFTYPTKKAAADAVRKVLHRYATGERLSSVDTSFIKALLDNHPRAAEKVGVGIASIQVERNGSTQGFWLTRTDGSRTDFSYLSCLTLPPPDQEAREAFRTAVRQQILAFRAVVFSSAAGGQVTCPITGEVLSLASCHVDHADPTFVQLVDSFLSGIGLALSAIPLRPNSDGMTNARIGNASIEQRWLAYHSKNAQLRVVSKRANLSLLRRGARGSNGRNQCH